MLNLAAHQQHSQRHSEWLAASQGFLCLGLEAEIQVQGLGHLDIELIWADDNAQILSKNDNPLVAIPWSHMSYRLTLARLWVLGGYELIRNLDQFEKSNPLEERIRMNIKEVKSRFERLRMPLAKLEAQKSHRATDFDVATPIVHNSEGTGWLINPNRFETRRALSDCFIQLGGVLAVIHGK